MIEDWILFVFEIIGLVAGILFSHYILPNNKKTKLLCMAFMVVIVAISIWIAATIRFEELSSIYIYSWVVIRYFVLTATIICMLGMSKRGNKINN